MAYQPMMVSNLRSAVFRHPGVAASQNGNPAMSGPHLGIRLSVPAAENAIFGWSPAHCHQLIVDDVGAGETVSRPVVRRWRCCNAGDTFRWPGGSSRSPHEQGCTETPSVLVILNVIASGVDAKECGPAVAQVPLINLPCFSYQEVPPSPFIPQS